GGWQINGDASVINGKQLRDREGKWASASIGKDHLLGQIRVFCDIHILCTGLKTCMGTRDMPDGGASKGVGTNPDHILEVQALYIAGQERHIKRRRGAAN